ncbi:MAG: Maf family protein [Acidimicrobiales bacterium]
MLSDLLRGRRVVLASGSRSRADVLRAQGVDADVDPPDVDERAFDHVFADAGAESLALTLARAKADAVAERHPDSVVIAGDQVGVVDGADGARMLTKQPGRVGAVAQLLGMAGTTHRLVNALVVLDTATHSRADGIDIQVVTMRRFTEAEAAAYVDRFEPWESAGSYRLEDGADMPAPFVIDVVGEDDSGVLGLPLPLLERLVLRVADPA